MAKAAPKTRIATSDATTVTIRGKSLMHDLIGKMSFTETMYFLIKHRPPTPAETKVLDACLVTLMEHGFTPSSLIARMAFDSVPDQVQVAMAAGLLSIGGVFVGTMPMSQRVDRIGFRCGRYFWPRCHTYQWPSIVAVALTSGGVALLVAMAACRLSGRRIHLALRVQLHLLDRESSLQGPDV